MVDLLQRFYSESEGWHPDADRADSLEQVCQKYLYDAPHAQHVSQLALNLFYQLHDLHQLSEKHSGILHAAAMLHDIGLFVAHPKHHKHSYYLIKSSGMNSFNKLDLDLIASIARYHRKAHPSQKHLAFSQLTPSNQQVVRKLSALLRVADAMDYKHQQRVKLVNCSITKSKTLAISASSAVNINDEIEWALDKGELVQEVFNVKLEIQKGKISGSR
jgi:exopolyphosphatase/guanosine-5'-triphosphate,3'-diphosphate pyrophosphatase